MTRAVSGAVGRSGTGAPGQVIGAKTEPVEASGADVTGETTESRNNDDIEHADAQREEADIVGAGDPRQHIRNLTNLNASLTGGSCRRKVGGRRVETSAVSYPRSRTASGRRRNEAGTRSATADESETSTSRGTAKD